MSNAIAVLDAAARAGTGVANASRCGRISFLVNAAYAHRRAVANAQSNGDHGKEIGQ